MTKDFTISNRISALRLVKNAKPGPNNLTIELNVDIWQEQLEQIKSIRKFDGIVILACPQDFPNVPVAQIKDSVLSAARGCKNAGIKNIGLSIDEDGFWQQFFSPKTNPDTKAVSKIEILTELFAAIKTSGPKNCGVALTIEELSPGGLDATDGVTLALALQVKGAGFFIASGGTNAFPALKNRRKTSMQNKHYSYKSPECWLGSAVWLIEKINVPILAQGPIENQKHAEQLAKELGFLGIISTN